MSRRLAIVLLYRVFDGDGLQDVFERSHLRLAERKRTKDVRSDRRDGKAHRGLRLAVLGAWQNARRMREIARRWRREHALFVCHLDDGPTRRFRSGLYAVHRRMQCRIGALRRFDLMALAMPMASAIEKAGVWSDSDIARCESVLCQGHNS